MARMIGAAGEEPGADGNDGSPFFVNGWTGGASGEEGGGGDGLGEAEDGSVDGLLAARRAAMLPAPTSEPRTSWKPPRPATRKRRRTREADKDKGAARRQLTSQQRLLLLDTWQRSKLSANDFAAMVGVSPHTLYLWKKRFTQDGPAGLESRPKGGPRGSRISDTTRRAIVMLKSAHPEWGERRIHDVLVRTEGFGASPRAIARVLAEEGYETVLEPTRPHPPKPTRFERARPNQLWQTDLFTFVLKRENRRVHAVAFMDDHSRFIVGFGLHASASGALVREVFEASVANFGAPEEVLTDNGTQYHTWRGKSEFRKLLDRRGIRQIVAAPRHPQTLGKVERFWQTLWGECVGAAIFRGLDDARRRIALFIDHYNFQRPHQGIDGLVPADRYFSAAPQVRETLERRVAANALELAKNGEPRKPFYLTGRVGSESISLHAEGERVVMLRADGSREEVDLGAPGQRAELEERSSLPETVAKCAAPADVEGTIDEQELAAPGTSELDGLLDRLEQGLAGGERDDADDDDSDVEIDDEFDTDSSNPDEPSEWGSGIDDATQYEEETR